MIACGPETRIARRMNRHDRLLYHQIHPLKLATDIGTAALASVAFWHHVVLSGLAIGFVPPILVTLALVRWADLTRYASSPFGRYVRGFMNRRVEAARFVGVALLWGGAWAHRPALIAFAALWILSCWLWGMGPWRSGTAGVRAAYRKRRLISIALGPAWLAYGVAILGTGWVPAHLVFWFLFGGVAVLAIVGALIWRCPACGAMLGRSLSHARCPKCGVALGDG